jgi:hypothetical protein
MATPLSIHFPRFPSGSAGFHDQVRSPHKEGHGAVGTERPWFAPGSPRMNDACVPRHWDRELFPLSLK